MRCWAPGMDGWRPLDQIAQLKWFLVCSGVALINESELAAIILNMFIHICSFYPTRWVWSVWPGGCGQVRAVSHCRDADKAVIRPLPRGKRMLTEAGALPHVVQLLLTFDPTLVEKVVTLLNDVMQDNPNLPRMFSSGVFFFIMMYTGSNILPIAHFLKYAHTKQSFRPDEVVTTPLATPMLIALVCIHSNRPLTSCSGAFWDSSCQRLWSAS